jgi:hypothetical protein
MNVRESKRIRVRDNLGALGALFLILLLIGLLVWSSGEQFRVLRQLPESQRTGLYHRTLDNLNTVCKGRDRDSLRDFCEDQAMLVLQFRECDDACKVIAKEYLPRPTK